MGSEFDAFATLFKGSYRTIVRFIFLRVNDRALAEDLAAESFAIAWAKHLSGVTIDLRWLFATARNVVGNEYQRRVRERARVQNVAMEELVNVEAWGFQIEDLDLDLAMRRLRPSDALLLQLTYWDGLSATQAAAFLDCSVAALWVRLTRARAALRILLDPSAAATSPMRARRGDRSG